MKLIFKMAVIAGVASVGAASHAQASPLCKLTGSYSDNFGSTTKIVGKKGTILNSAICATAYNFKITAETVTGFTVTGKNPTKSCGTFSAQPTFMGSCSVFGGSVTIHGATISDTFTKIPGSVHAAPPVADGLTTGLK